MSARKYSPEFKARVVLESLRGDISQAEICRRYNIASAQLEQLVGRLTLELEILKKTSSMLKGPRGGKL